MDFCILPRKATRCKTLLPSGSVPTSALLQRKEVGPGIFESLYIILCGRNHHKSWFNSCLKTKRWWYNVYCVCPLFFFVLMLFLSTVWIDATWIKWGRNSQYLQGQLVSSKTFISIRHHRRGVNHNAFFSCKFGLYLMVDLDDLNFWSVDSVVDERWVLRVKAEADLLCSQRGYGLKMKVV